MPNLETLRDEYLQLYLSCQIRKEKDPVFQWVLDRIVKNEQRYRSVSRQVGVPWYFIAAIHALECGLKFGSHLHNGDPLTEKTVHVPKGRPTHDPVYIPQGATKPVYTWEESAVDALTYMKLHRWTDWSIEAMLFKLEAYNGWGYRKHHPNVLTPYLWAGSLHYDKGKYVADGKWSDTAVSNQIGAGLILKGLKV